VCFFKYNLVITKGVGTELTNVFDFLLWKSDHTIKIQLNVHVHPTTISNSTVRVQHTHTHTQKPVLAVKHGSCLLGTPSPVLSISRLTDWADATAVAC